MPKSKPGKSKKTDTARKAAPRAAAKARGSASSAKSRLKAASTADANSPLPPFTVIYIHGIGDQPDAPSLKPAWDKALFGLDMASRTRMAYWADINHPRSGAGPSVRVLSLDASPSASGLGISESGEDLSIPELANPKAAAYARSLAATLTAEQNVGSIQARRFETKVLPGFIRKPITEFLSKLLIKDTAAYFFDVGKKEAMQARLRSLLIPDGGPYVLVSHSQGTIISYDVLTALAKQGLNVRVPLWITLGSPLGLAEVQDHIAKPLAKPSIVGEWKNYADRLDPVALDASLSDEFKPLGAILDQRVSNPDAGLFSGFNPHSSLGYLRTPEVRTAVLNQVGAQFPQLVHRFVIARDVAREMSVPDARVAVLIELNEEADGDTLEEKGSGVAGAIADLIGDQERLEKARVEVLKRFVSARLTGPEIDALSYRHRELKFVTVWRNSVKRALIDKSIYVVQASTAQAGYDARGQDIHWAVLDTGIKRDHPHFKNKDTIAAEWDCTRPGPAGKSPGAPDGDGHGTHVAGIIAGASADGRYRGMAPDCKLHIYKVLGDDGSGEDAWIIKALDHIAQVNESSPELRIHGINLSLGGPFDASVFGCGHSPLCRELRRLWRQGVVVCVAAGNEGLVSVKTSAGITDLNNDLSIGDPANLEEAIAVGSVNRDHPHIYGVSYFSSKGPTADGRIKPDVVAPGERINSCNYDFVKNDPGTHYVAMNGTSMACPHVSGIVAGFLSVRREFIGYPERVKDLLMAHCTDLKRDRYHQGAGMPNLTKMLFST